MKKQIGVLVILAALVVPGVLATKALTQISSPPTITITEAAQPLAGQPVGVSGNYTIPSGYTLNSITVDIRPTGGVAGEGGEGTASADGMGGFSAMLSVPPATYDVQAYLTYTDSNSNVGYIFSNVVIGFVAN